MSMDGASFQFLFFGLVAALISNLSASRLWRSVVLFVASIATLALLARDLIACLPVAGFLLLGFGALLLLERGWSRLRVFGIVAVVLAYVWLKQYTFLPAGILLRRPYLMLGLSYIFFRVLHLLIDSDTSGSKVRIGLWGYLLYTLNFTTLVSGPIQRYDEFAKDQFAEKPIALGPGVVCLQLERLVRGFFKVNVLATLLDTIHTDALTELLQPLPVPLKLYAALRLAVTYPLFLYANFSGYIDIVIALARLMRVRLPENFDHPFAAASVLEFWNRWHMTLSHWFKTYVYNPLVFALVRRTSSLALQPALGVLGFFVTFFLVGVWHGRTSEFVIFGLLTGGGASVNKLWQLILGASLGRKGYGNLAKSAFYIALGRGLNFSWFAFTLFWFWADWRRIENLFAALSLAKWFEVWLAIWLVTSLVLDLWQRLRVVLLSIQTAEGPVITSRYARVIYASALGLASIVMVVLLNQPAPGIVYKAF